MKHNVTIPNNLFDELLQILKKLGLLTDRLLNHDHTLYMKGLYLHRDTFTMDTTPENGYSEGEKEGTSDVSKMVSFKIVV